MTDARAEPLAGAGVRVVADPRGRSRLRDLARRRNDTAVAITGALGMPLVRCECGGERCQRRLVLSAAEYRAAHADARWHIVAPEHAAPDVAVVVSRRAGHAVVQVDP